MPKAATSVAGCDQIGIYTKMEFNSQKIEMLLFLTSNMTAMTSRAN